MQKIAWLFGLFLLLMTACDKDDQPLEDEAHYTGTWVFDHQEEGVSVYRRATDLDHEKPGYIIKSTGAIISRTNSSWCGTPPVVYENYSGTWKAELHNVITITTASWSGTITYKLKVLSVNGTQLKTTAAN